MVSKKKTLLLASALAALAVTIYFALASRGQSPAAGRAIELLPPTVHVNANSGGVVTTDMLNPNPGGVDIPARKGLLGVVQVASAPTGGTSGTNSMDIYLQASADNGLTWQDFANVHPTAAGTYVVPVSFLDGTSYPTTIPLNKDGTIATKAISPYVMGRRIRAKYQFSYAFGSTGSWAFRVTVVPQ